MKICNICHKISATGDDHLDCTQKRNIETQDKNFKDGITEKLSMSKDTNDLGVEIRAILEHLAKEKSKD